MQLSSELEAFHREISDADWQFRQWAHQDSECLSRASFAALDPFAPLQGGPIQPWPVFIDSRKARELARVTVGLSRLIRGIPRRVFDNDSRRLAEFYGLASPELVDLILAPPNNLEDCLARGDFIHTESGFQCLELNIAGNLGGFASATVAEVQLKIPAIARFIQDRGLEASFQNTTRLLFDHVLRKAHVTFDDRELHMIVGVDRQGEIQRVLGAGGSGGRLFRSVLDQLNREYAAALQDIDTSLRGSVALSDYSDLVLRRGEVYRGTQRVHALLEMQLEPTRQMAFRSFKSRNLLLYNGPITLLLNDKRNLALLSENESELFDEDERALIRDHVPWTRRVIAGDNSYRGAAIILPDFLIAERDKIVLKKGKSFEGKDVVMGRFTAPDRWARAVDDALASGDWIAQELAQSRPYLCQQGVVGCAPHNVIWEPFAFGDTYAGSGAKMSPRSVEGVVNAAKGATTTFLIEVP